MSGLGVFHLVRKANGMEPLQKFLRSFEAHRPDQGCELTFILKGFNGPDDEAPYRQAVKHLNPIFVSVGDEGFDIYAYIQAAEQSRCETLLFFNSFSEILGSDWLRIYQDNFRADVGMIGATGSFESTSASYLEIARADKNPFTKVLRLLKALYLYVLFPGFPNVHLRTNGIMIRRQDFLAAKRPIRSKMDALCFESGRRSLSRTIQKKGLRLLLVTRDGKAHESQDWFRADAFRVGTQRNLLIADNQTRAYDAASEPLKQALRIASWGE